MRDSDPDDVHGTDVTPEQIIRLQEDGFLAYINRSAFHPMGFALSYDPISGEFALLGDGDEPYNFKDDRIAKERHRTFWRKIDTLRKR